jgi:serine/threonine protein kinase
MDDREPGNEQPFTGTSRFEVVSHLGIGGMGIVYEALDRECGQSVALKTLRSMSPQALVRFKNEFRALQDLHHPNLVRLGELIEENGQWFFTMELVHGRNFLRHVRSDAGAIFESESPALALTGTVGTPSSSVTTRESPPSPPRPAMGPDLGRLRSSLAQLVHAVSALHAAGKIHRDIKPSNILITTEGRVVLLDFGVIKDVDDTDTESRAVGTLAYMAPEQAAGEPVGTPADWYSVGAVLYQALTGTLPFSGSSRMDLLSRKARAKPVPPSQLVPETPEDLDRLCLALLTRDPAGRPTAREILRQLHVDADGSTAPSATGHERPFVGREHELSVLRQAFVDSRRGRPVCVLVHGESGIGKSALLRQFTRHLSVELEDAVVLGGRCYERESVPYKAIDGVVDSLSRYLDHLPRVDATALLPRMVALLAQVFPALLQVEAIAAAPSPNAQLDPREQRTRVIGALRELLARIADARPLVVVIDDLQWADPDSLHVLRDLFGPTDAPALLLVATVRGTSESVGLTQLGDTPINRLDLAPLSKDEAHQLASLLLPTRPDTAAAIASEAAGHPLFLHELLHHALLCPGDQVPVALDQAISARVQALDRSARDLLQVIVVAGEPLPQAVMAEAAACPAHALDASLASLRAAKLVRTAGARASTPVEPFHDRVRTAVLATVSATAQKQHHARLAVALESSGWQKPETLAFHWHAAEDTARAAPYALLAARQAAAVLAFARAARLYQLALDLGGDGDVGHIQAELGDALAYGGRCAEAARRWLVAAQGADAALALRLRQRAAAELLVSGHVEEGMVVLGQVLRSVGLRLPRSLSQALAAALALRVRIRLSGLRFAPRDESQLTAEELTRIDMCWAAAIGLSYLDLFRGMYFISRHTVLALKAGEPTRVARALHGEVIQSSFAGGPARKRTARLVDLAGRIAHETKSPMAIAWATFIAGTAAHMEGRFRPAHELQEKADALFGELSGSVTHERSVVRLSSGDRLFLLGQIGELTRRVPLYRREADDRGDRFMATALRAGYFNLATLAQDDVAGARQDAAVVLRERSGVGTFLLSYMLLTAEAYTDLYEHPMSDIAWQRMGAGWPALRKSFMLKVQIIRVFMHNMRGSAALAAARGASGRVRARFVASAEKDARRIAREHMPYADPMAKLLFAGVAALSGDTARAESLLRQAAGEFSAAGMALHEKVCQHSLGQLLGGDPGRTLVGAAEAWMRGEAIANPTRFAAMLAPAFAVPA